MKKEKNFKKFFIFVIPLFLIFIFVFALIFREDVTRLIARNNSVMSVNGREITKDDLTFFSKKAIRELPSTEREDISEEELWGIITEMAIKDAVQEEYFERMGIFATDMEVETYYDVFIEREDDVNTKSELFVYWDERGYSEKDLRRIIEKRIKNRKLGDYFRALIDITEDRLKELFADYKLYLAEELSGEELDKEEMEEAFLEEKDIFRRTIEDRTILSLVTEQLEEIRRDADIEVF